MSIPFIIIVIILTTFSEFYRDPSQYFPTGGRLGIAEDTRYYLRLIEIKNCEITTDDESLRQSLSLWDSTAWEVYTTCIIFFMLTKTHRYSHEIFYIKISKSMKMTVDSNLNGISPQFTLAFSFQFCFNCALVQEHQIPYEECTTG